MCGIALGWQVGLRYKYMRVSVRLKNTAWGITAYANLNPF